LGKLSFDTVTHLKDRNILFLWIGTTVSNLGFQFYTFVIPLIIYSITNSALAMSGVKIVNILPFIVFGLFAGVLVDRYKRKFIMLVVTTTQIIVLVAVTGLSLLVDLNVLLIYILCFILSTCSLIFSNAKQSILPTLIKKEVLLEVNSLMHISKTLIRVIGPGAAGIIIALFTFRENFLIFTCTLIILLMLILNLKVAEESYNFQEKDKKKSLIKEIKHGINEIFNNKMLYDLTIIVIIMNLSSSFVNSTLFFYLADTLAASSIEIGIVFSIGAGGAALVSSLVVKRIYRTMNMQLLINISILIYFVGTVVLVVINQWWLVTVAIFIRTFVATLLNIIYITQRQINVPNEILGRVTGSTNMLMKVVVPFGALVGGLWVDFLGIKSLYLVSAILVLFLYFSTLRQIGSSNSY
jgi:predicted MFS family arabinose efflux permease